jgi:hypothetical protein
VSDEPFSFTDDEIEYLSMMSALTANRLGYPVLVGLNAEETARFMQFSRGFPKHRIHDPAMRQDYLDLYNRHELARLEVIGLTRYVQDHDPARH